MNHRGGWVFILGELEQLLCNLYTFRKAHRWKVSFLRCEPIRNESGSLRSGWHGC